VTIGARPMEALWSYFYASLTAKKNPRRPEGDGWRTAVEIAAADPRKRSPITLRQVCKERCAAGELEYALGQNELGKRVRYYRPKSHCAAAA